MWRFNAEYKDGKLFYTEIFEVPDNDQFPITADRVSIFIVPEHLSIYYFSKNKDILGAFSSGMYEMMKISETPPEIYFKEYADKFEKITGKC